ncbi:SRPBCC family protein [Flavobacterium sp. TSSA_36]|uniref:SRPBCC family protein n=1 Tax=Flavobacterium sp. TSSA_36 TaxID=3447669 RepID=UPI003F36C125
MQILKYLFLLLVLSAVASTIFVATQKGEFQLERSKVINSPKSAVYNYVNDYQNWPDFNSWMLEDSELKMTFPEATSGKGAFCSWIGAEGTGDIQTLSTKRDETITQKLNNNGTESEVFWHFKDTVGGTKVTWKTKGNLSFELKMLAALKGGVARNLGSIYEKSLTNLDKILDYEMNTYSVKVVGEVRKTATYYLSQSFSSKTSNIQKNSKIVFEKLQEYCDKNSIETYGKPFIIYHLYDTTQETVSLSFGLPIKNEILVSPESGLKLEKLETFPAIKTIVKGDYSHLKQAKVQIDNYFTSKGIVRDRKFLHLEVITIGRNESNKPSKWVTTLYSPIQPKVIPAPVIRTAVPKKKISETTIEEAIPSEF